MENSERASIPRNGKNEASIFPTAQIDKKAQVLPLTSQINFQYNKSNNNKTQALIPSHINSEESI